MSITTRILRLAAGALLALGSVQAFAGEPPATGTALSEDECRAIWNTGAGRSGFFGPDGAKPYVDSFEAIDTNHDNQISNAEFKAGCTAGLVHKFRPQN